MDFISLSYGVFLLTGIVLYYSIPKKRQWIWLLLLGIFFYVHVSGKLTFFIAMSTLTSYLFGVFADVIRKKKPEEQQKRILKAALFIVIAGNVLVLFLLKLAASANVWASRLHLTRFSLWLPVGISFYTLQIVAYCVDVYRGKVEPQKNPAKYALFVTFFPQILQGPIPRYQELSKELFEGHDFQYRKIVSGLELMLWGFFQKLVIADRANIVVNRIYGEYESYQGFLILLAGFLYSIQLYADFSGCVCIARGSAALFGIELGQNFEHPYFADSVADFWHRWHISLSQWLRDYVYIPLGGNRKGNLRKYLNIMLTFLVSGIWHGIGMHFIVWGCMHGACQVIGSILRPVRDWLVRKMSIDRNSFSHRLYKQSVTFVLVMLAWMVFRAESMAQVMGMFRNMFSVFNPWVLVNGELYLLGISGMEFRLLLFGIFLMWTVGMLQVKFHANGQGIRMVLEKQSLAFRWTLILLAIFAVLIFGVYGPGYDAAQFIYGGF
ncbi:MAG: MBOAT family protein [Lachnospiraceae bacterium]|nr:MBOAT family protein [Lachnospiraceae bacterium]